MVACVVAVLQPTLVKILYFTGLSLAYRVHREAAARNAHKGATVSAGSSSGNYGSWTAL